MSAEDAAAAALERVEMGSRAQRLAQVAREGTHVSALAAGHPDYSPRQSQSRIVSDIDPA